MRIIVSVLLLIQIMTIDKAKAGVWDYGSFDDDIAADWAYQLHIYPNTEVVEAALRAVPNKGYIDSDLCSMAIAAAEVTAAAKDGDMSQLPNNISPWVEANRSQFKKALAALALNSVKNCKDQKRSELAQLWSEGDANLWVAQLFRIEQRLK